MRKIYIAGNALFDEDSMPLKLKPLLQKEFLQIEFVEFDPTENFPENTEEFFLIDTVKGITEPQLFTDIDDFINKKRVSMHDFDIAWEMKLMKKAGKLHKVVIIGIPSERTEKEIFKQVKLLIEKQIF